MATDPEFLEHIRDLFSGLGQVGTGRMFGGTALYVEEDVMFATILGDVVWMKSDDSTYDQFLKAGSAPFTYERKNGPLAVTSLMSLPDGAMDDPDEAVQWARLSIPPARAAAEKKRVEKARKAARKAK